MPDIIIGTRTVLEGKESPHWVLIGMKNLRYDNQIEVGPDRP